MVDRKIIDRETAISMLVYFWKEKEDIERWTGYDGESIRKEFPAVFKAWEDYKACKAVLNAVMRDLES